MPLATYLTVGAINKEWRRLKMTASVHTLVNLSVAVAYALSQLVNV
jgi:hypothetical protein